MKSVVLVTTINNIIIAILCQFSSFVPQYLLPTPAQFITPVAINSPLQDYIQFQSARLGKQTSRRKCPFPFVKMRGICRCPPGFILDNMRCISRSLYPDQRGDDYQQEAENFRQDEMNFPILDEEIDQQLFNLSQELMVGDDQVNKSQSGNNSVNKKPQPPQIVECPILKIDEIRNRQQVEALALIQRAYEGTNNNQKNTDWGSSGSLLQRRLPANYLNGINQPIDNLPSPRLISNILGSQAEPLSRSSLNITMAFTIFGQFVDHDIDLTFAQRSSPTSQFMDIQVPKDDKFFKDQQVIKFTRSNFVESQDQDSQQPRRHKNMVTSWLDASQVYGSERKTNCALRTFQKGKLKTSGQDGEEFLPQLGGFFRAGDVRAIQNSILTTYHTAFLREHNRICDLIIRRNPNFNDETIFQIARNYVIGILQKIVMKDFLPILLGQKYRQVIGQYKGYKNNINPNIPTQFSSAGYRLGHALLVNTIPLINERGRVQKNIQLDEMFFKQDFISAQFMVKILRGAARTLSKQRDSQFADSVRNLLVLDPNNRQVKLDLFSINVQRGRDHGLATYNEARAAFGLPKIRTFQQFLPPGKGQLAKRLRAIYGNPDKMELFVGIISQKPVRNGLLGELGVQIVGQTFRNLRDADRFWYQRVYPRKVINAINKLSLRDICKRNIQVQDLQDNIFLFTGR